MGRINPTGVETRVSGPSATSDIELNRAEGARRPRSVDVVIVNAAQ
jgi:L-lactate utilization protein LutC